MEFIFDSIIELVPSEIERNQRGSDLNEEKYSMQEEDVIEEFKRNEFEKVHEFLDEIGHIQNERIEFD